MLLETVTTGSTTCVARKPPRWSRRSGICRVRTGHRSVAGPPDEDAHAVHQDVEPAIGFVDGGQGVTG